MEKYFLGSNTRSGFKGYYEETTGEIGRVYLLKGGAGTGKSSLIKKVMKQGVERGFDCEAWHCSGDPNSLDGVYISALDVAVIDATSPHAVEPKMPSVKDDIINLLQCVSKDKIKGYRSVIEKLANSKKECYINGYEHLNIAFCHMAQNLRAVSSSMNTSLIILKAREFAMDLLSELKCLNDDKIEGSEGVKSADDIGEMSRDSGVKGRVVKRFFRAITPDGIVVYDDHLKGKTIWHIRGEVVSVDLFLRTALDIVKESVKGVNEGLVIFSNPLDASLIDGFMIGDIVVTGYLESSDGAMVYDLRWYEGDFDKYALSRAKTKMKDEIDIAVDYFAKARGVHLGIERYYISAMDFDRANEMTDRLIDEIFEIKALE